MESVTLSPLHLAGLCLLAGLLVAKAFYQGYQHGRLEAKKEELGIDGAD